MKKELPTMRHPCPCIDLSRLFHCSMHLPPFPPLTRWALTRASGSRNVVSAAARSTLSTTTEPTQRLRFTGQRFALWGLARIPRPCSPTRRGAGRFAGAIPTSASGPCSSGFKRALVVSFDGGGNDGYFVAFRYGWNSGGFQETLDATPQQQEVGPFLQEGLQSPKSPKSFRPWDRLGVLLRTGVQLLSWETIWIPKVRCNAAGKRS
jgi:hypothetical protein